MTTALKKMRQTFPQLFFPLLFFISGSFVPGDFVSVS